MGSSEIDPRHWSLPPTPWTSPWVTRVLPKGQGQVLPRSDGSFGALGWALFPGTWVAESSWFNRFEPHSLWGRPQRRSSSTGTAYSAHHVGAPSQLPICLPQCPPLSCLRGSLDLSALDSRVSIHLLLRCCCWDKGPVKSLLTPLGPVCGSPAKVDLKPPFLPFCHLWPDLNIGFIFPSTPSTQASRQGRGIHMGLISFISLGGIWWRFFSKVIAKQNQSPDQIPRYA